MFGKKIKVCGQRNAGYTSCCCCFFSVLFFTKVFGINSQRMRKIAWKIKRDVVKKQEKEESMQKEWEYK